MSKINIKIVEVDQGSHTVVLKYASEKSVKTIDEYPGVAFQVSNYNVANLDEFIEAIRPQISLYVYYRDLAESPNQNIDISSWSGQSVEVNAFELPAPAPQPVEALANPEVTL
jgi:hypothetical protein